MTSIFSPTLVVWAGLTVPPALLILTTWIGYRRTRARDRLAIRAGVSAPIPLTPRHAARPAEIQAMPERRAA